MSEATTVMETWFVGPAGGRPGGCMYLVAGGDEQAAYDEAQRLGLRLYRQTVTTRFEEILISGKSAGNRTHHRRSEP